MSMSSPTFSPRRVPDGGDELNWLERSAEENTERYVSYIGVHDCPWFLPWRSIDWQSVLGHDHFQRRSES